MVLRLTLSQVGNIGDRLSLARDTSLGIGRITHFASDIGREWIAPEFQVRLGAVAKDVVSLNDLETQLSNKVQFLLDAVLGFITIAQNDLFKVLTIASVVGMPPTLVAGIYGMNFKNMPETRDCARERCAQPREARQPKYEEEHRRLRDCRWDCVSAPGQPLLVRLCHVAPRRRYELAHARRAGHAPFSRPLASLGTYP